MKKFVIRCDMEGVSGIVSYEQAEPGKSEYAIGQRYFMDDLMALMNGLNDGGADEILIYDEHFYGRNVDMNVLPENVTVICGKPLYEMENAGGLTAECDGMILLGYHSKRGTENALLNHTYEPDIRNITINGVSVGEIGVEAGIAGDFNVPFVLITGDSEGVRGAEELAPDVIGVVVKESMSEFGALCYSGVKTASMIYNAAKSLAQSDCCMKPVSFGNTVEMEVEFFDTAFAKLYLEIYGKPVFKGKTVIECWISYCSNKNEINKLLASGV